MATDSTRQCSIRSYSLEENCSHESGGEGIIYHALDNPRFAPRKFKLLSERGRPGQHSEVPLRDRWNFSQSGRTPVGI